MKSSMTMIDGEIEVPKDQRSTHFLLTLFRFIASYTVTMKHVDRTMPRRAKGRDIQLEIGKIPVYSPIPAPVMVTLITTKVVVGGNIIRKM